MSKAFSLCSGRKTTHLRCLHWAKSNTGLTQWTSHLPLKSNPLEKGQVQYMILYHEESQDIRACSSSNILYLAYLDAQIWAQLIWNGTIQNQIMPLFKITMTCHYNPLDTCSNARFPNAIMVYGCTTLQFKKWIFPTPDCLKTYVWPVSISSATVPVAALLNEAKAP